LVAAFAGADLAGLASSSSSVQQRGQCAVPLFTLSGLNKMLAHARKKGILEKMAFAFTVPEASRY
jgi:hypothetical protein